MKNKDYKYLSGIKSPNDIKNLTEQEIAALCHELRSCIIETCTQNGGHVASNLGVVELSVAIHKVFDCPRDHIIFDVGHQSYTHKLLTGRYEDFDTLRKPGGLSGFTKREESEYDCFGAGHSSTSLSAGIGMAEADRLSGSEAYTIVVLGDGAFTGGMIHEALNNCNKSMRRLIIILNENEMSISKNIGGFANSIAKLRKKKGYFKAKKFTISFIKKIPLLGNVIFKCIRSVKKAFKNMLYGSNYFEDMGLYYLGPADGNNYESVEALLNAAKNAGECVLVHLKTQKGKGYEPAEASPDKYHGIPPVERITSDSSFSQEMGKELSRLADADDKICAITAAMSSGTGLDEFEKAHPERFFDVGIAEEHGATFAAGLSVGGKKPVFAVYSTFLQRSYDQMIHDISLQNLPVVFCIDRSGFNNADGATHHGIFDVAFISQMPNFRLYTPVTYEGLRTSLNYALSSDTPCAIRYPSGSQEDCIVNEFYGNGNFDEIGIKCNFHEGDLIEYVIITHGRISKECIAAKEILEQENIRVGIILCEYIAPYNEIADKIQCVLAKMNVRSILFVEEEIKNGGFGMILSEQMRKSGYLLNKNYDIMAAEEPFVSCSWGQSFIQASGLDCISIAQRIREMN